MPHSLYTHFTLTPHSHCTHTTHSHCTHTTLTLHSHLTHTTLTLHSHHTHLLPMHSCHTHSERHTHTALTTHSCHTHSERHTHTAHMTHSHHTHTTLTLREFSLRHVTDLSTPERRVPGRATRHVSIHVLINTCRRTAALLYFLQLQTCFSCTKRRRV